MHVLTC
jgi:hypothetical protein